MEASMKLGPHRLILNILDQLAQSEPDKVYAELPISLTDFSAGFRHITYRVLDNAVNGVAWWLTETLGPAQDFPTLAYVGPNDLSHNLLLLGAIKAGYKMLFFWPRYSTEAQVRLMKAVDCQNILTSSVSSPLSQLVETIAKEHGSAKVTQIPELASFFDDKHQVFPYKKSFEEARGDPLVVVHTSGTTGFPRPIIWNHDWAASFAYQRYLEPPAGWESIDRLILGRRVLSLMPPYHASHLFASILFTFYCGNTCIYPPALALPTAQIAAEASSYTEVKAITVVPPHIEQLGANTELLDTLVRNGAETVFWAGGPVSSAAADAVSSRLKLFNTCGSTEMGMWPVIRKSGPWDPSISRYMCFHPQANVQLRPQSENVFKAVVVKNDSDTEIQPPFPIFPSITEYDSGDLFSPVAEPDKDYLWSYVGRSDDMQVFKNGLKWHPTAAEQKIISDNRDVIQEALLDGTNHAHVVLLLELVSEFSNKLAALPEGEQAKEKAAILDGIWPTIEGINRVAPDWVQIDRQRVVFAEPGKPLARTAKGSIRRLFAVTDYKSQIDDVLESVGVKSEA
ncbi:putative NRPS-like enzyme [Talaromyces proteolyticus]|uniref:NRPS-like enzyme n=1 Tax=Talaromyces proteolyticus TaxID=1131652 RepID=A0AAD4KGD5_9EURO|nr:putative NRPS-like enzyme [Talaromyces proteolyticus]KAH8690545.1 putative NRPS-like enzyme [Talaromyces proteolyticus]